MKETASSKQRLKNNAAVSKHREKKRGEASAQNSQIETLTKELKERQKAVEWMTSAVVKRDPQMDQDKHTEKTGK